MIHNKFTQSEWDTLVSFMKTLGSYIPNDKASYVWNTFNKITGKNEREPCMCPSSAGTWGRAVREIESFIRSVQ